jgi:hypothetical protein
MTRMARGQDRFEMVVTDRAPGMGVHAGHLSLHIAGMTAPTTPLALMPFAEHGSTASRSYAAQVRLMPGAYTVVIDVDGRAAALPIRIP